MSFPVRPAWKAQIMARTALVHPRTGRELVPLSYRADGRPIMPILGGDGTDPLARINELVALGYEALTAEQLAELRGLIDTERQAISAATDVDAAHIGQVADIAVAMRAEADRRAAAPAEPAVSADDARARLDAAFADPAAAPAVPAATAPVEATPAAAPAVADPAPVAPVATIPAPAAPAEVPVPVAASVAAPRPAPLSAVVQTAQQHSEPGNDRAPIAAALVASAGRATGQTITERTRDEALADMADGFDQVIRDLRSTRGGQAGGRMRIPITSSRWSRGGPAVSDGNDYAVNRRLMDEAVRNTPRADAAGALVASGGICRPLTVDYGVPTWSNIEEPIKAALPAIDAPRGGLTYGLPVPYDATVFEEGVVIWSEANDRNPGGANTGPNSNPAGVGPVTKPCVEIDCSDFTDVIVEAITKCATATNFRARFSPENMNVLLTYLEQAFVSVAERERLRQMRRACTHNNAQATFGTSRDLFNFFDKLRAYYRSRYRLSDSVPLRVVLNSYVRELIRIDLRKAAFPYEAGQGAPPTSLDVPDSFIDAWLATKGLSPIWTLDDDTGDQTFLPAGDGTQGNPVAFPNFPAGTATNSVKVRCIAYPEGSFQLLDGGQLDLGVVRDSVLNSQNKFQMFAEIFEAVAFRGFEATDWTIDTIVDGSTSGTKTPAAAI